MIRKRLIASVAGASAAAAVTLAGCASDNGTGATAMADESSASASAKGASQIWAENCARCHNTRSPDSLSDAEWDVAMMHMRVQASLTGEEQRAVLKLMKASN